MGHALGNPCVRCHRGIMMMLKRHHNNGKKPKMRAMTNVRKTGTQHRGLQHRADQRIGAQGRSLHLCATVCGGNEMRVRYATPSELQLAWASSIWGRSIVWWTRICSPLEANSFMPPFVPISNNIAKKWFKPASRRASPSEPTSSRPTIWKTLLPKGRPLTCTSLVL